MGETCFVDSVCLDRGFCHVQRSSGDRVFFHISDVLSQFRDRWNERSLYVGSWVYVGQFVMDDSVQKLKCLFVELFSPEELAVFDATDVDRILENNIVERPIPELPRFVDPPKPVVPASSCSLLCPENRSVPLIDLIRRRKAS